MVGVQRHRDFVIRYRYKTLLDYMPAVNRCPRLEPDVAKLSNFLVVAFPNRENVLNGHENRRAHDNTANDKCNVGVSLKLFPASTLCLTSANHEQLPDITRHQTNEKAHNGKIRQDETKDKVRRRRDKTGHEDHGTRRGTRHGWVCPQM